MKIYILLLILARLLFADDNYFGFATLRGNVQDNYIPSDTLFNNSKLQTINNYNSLQSQSFYTIEPEFHYLIDKFDINIEPTLYGLFGKIDYTLNESLKIGIYNYYNQAYVNPYQLNTQRATTYQMETGLRLEKSLNEAFYSYVTFAKNYLGSDTTSMYGSLNRNGASFSVNAGANITKDINCEAQLQRYILKGMADSNNKYSIIGNYSSKIESYNLDAQVKVSKLYYEAINPIFMQTRLETITNAFGRITKESMFNIKPLYCFAEVAQERRMNNIVFFNAKRLYYGIGIGSGF